MLSIQPNYIFFSNFDEIKRKPLNEMSYKNLTYNKFRVNSNILSEQTKSKIKKNFNWMFKKSYNKYIEYKGKTFKHNLSFITLTLPSQQVHKDSEIKSCLNQFFTEFQKIHLFKNYIWKAERQKNNNIHFHIITDSYAPWIVIRNKWNRIIDKFGYISEFSKKMKKLNYKEYLKKYNYEDNDKRKNYYTLENRTGWKNPNTVDVKNVISKKKADFYLLKYISKDEENTKPIQGKRVGFSEKLSQIRYLGAFMLEKKDQIRNYLIRFNDVDFKSTDYGSIAIFKNIVDYLEKDVRSMIAQFFDEFIQYEPSIYDHEYYQHQFNQVNHKVAVV